MFWRVTQAAGGHRTPGSLLPPLPGTHSKSPDSCWVWDAQRPKGCGFVLQLPQKNLINLIPPTVLKILWRVQMCHFVNSCGLEDESFSSHFLAFPVMSCQCLVTPQGKAVNSL